jgi:uncharacterized membrane protein YfcA
VLVAGGLLGVVPAVYLLRHIDAATFRICFGVFIASYAVS